MGQGTEAPRTRRVTLPGVSKPLESRLVAQDLVALGVAVLAGLVVADPYRFAGPQLVALLIVASGVLLGGYRPDRVDLALVVFLSVNAASLWWSDRPSLTAQLLWFLSAALLVFLIARGATTTPRAVTLAAAGYVVGLVVAVHRLSQGDYGALLEPGSLYDRSAEAELNVNYTAYAAAGLIPMLAAATQGRRGRRAVLAGGLAFSAVVTSAIGTRGGAVALIFVGAWLLLGRFRDPLFRPLCVGVAAVAVALTTGLLDDRLKLYATGQADARETGTLNGRLLMWPLARGIIEEDPVLGRGAGTIPGFHLRGTYAHNVLLDVGAGVGLLGLAVYVVAMWLLLAAIVRRWGRTVAGAFFAAAAAPLLSGYWYTAPALWVVAGVLAANALRMPHGAPPVVVGAPQRVSSPMRR